MAVEVQDDVQKQGSIGVGQVKDADLTKYVW
jgi:hypothetical protein